MIRKTFVVTSGATWLGQDTEIRDVLSTHYGSRARTYITWLICAFWATTYAWQYGWIVEFGLCIGLGVTADAPGPITAADASRRAKSKKAPLLLLMAVS